MEQDFENEHKEERTTRKYIKETGFINYPQGFEVPITLTRDAYTTWFPKQIGAALASDTGSDERHPICPRQVGSATSQATKQKL